MSADAIRDRILTAQMQVRLAHAMYYGEAGVRALAEKFVCRFRNYKSNNLAAAALIFPDHVHLSICGTNDEYDWAINCNSVINTFGICETHQGYADASIWLAEELMHSGFPQLVEGKRLYVGGHSAGGAIAEMLPLCDNNWFRFKPEAVFTFGAPKWCESKSVAEYTAQPWKCHRFVMPYDPVPYLPLTLWRRLLLRRYFAHTTKAYELHDDGSWELADDLDATKRAASVTRGFVTGGIASVIAALRNVFRVPAHQSQRYKAAIEAACNQYE